MGAGSTTVERDKWRAADMTVSPECDCPVQPTESGVNYYVEHRPGCKRSAAPPQNWLRDVVQASQDEVASWPAWKRPKVPSPSKLAIRICRRINLETRVGSTKTIDWDHAVEIVEEEIGANAPAPAPPHEIVTEEIARELLQAFRDATLTIGSSVEAMRAALLAVLPKIKESMAITEEQWIAGARVLAEQVMHYSWDGLQPGRVDKRYPAFSVGGHANAHQGDYIDAVKEIVLAVIPTLTERMGHE